MTSTREWIILDSMFGLGPMEILLIVVAIVLIFGATRLPQIGEGLGKGIKNFRGALREPPEIDVTPPKDADSDPDKPASGAS